MQDRQKAEFADRLKRIERNPGNGRMVAPGAADIFAEDTKRRKGRQEPKMAPRPARKRPARPGLSWLYGAVVGFAMFAVWTKIYPGMETPQNWSMSSLPVDPTLGGSWVAVVLIFGLTLLRQFNLRMGFLMVIGLLMGGLGLAGVALWAPDVGEQLTTDRFVASVQGIYGSIDWGDA